MSDPIGFRQGFATISDGLGLPFALVGLPVGFTLISPVIDWTVPAVHVLIAPCAWFLRGPGTGVAVTARDGTVTTPPVLKYGTNATNDNYCASQTGPAAFGTTSAGFLIASSATSVSPIPSTLDLSLTGFRLEIVTGAVLGTATQLKGRFLNTIALFRP